MDKENELPKRKHPRLKGFDYSSSGAYFITICTQNRRCTLSKIEAENVKKTKYGIIAEEQLLSLNERYPSLTVDNYVIMPNHIHVILFLNNETAGASPRPTVMDIVCAYKSLTARECKKNGFEKKLFQDSFFEHVIRGREDYTETVKYICKNPIRWCNDELYTKNKEENEYE